MLSSVKHYQVNQHQKRPQSKAKIGASLPLPALHHGHHAQIREEGLARACRGNWAELVAVLQHEGAPACLTLRQAHTGDHSTKFCGYRTSSSSSHCCCCVFNKFANIKQVQG